MSVELNDSTELEGVTPEILFLCTGNVLRSQTGEMFSRLSGVPALSAAVGEVSKQHYQDTVPPHIVGLFWKLGLDNEIRGKRIKGVNEEMLAQVKHIVAFCSPEELARHPLIDMNDPRLHLRQTPDPDGHPEKYLEVVASICHSVHDFLEEYFPNLNHTSSDAFEGSYSFRRLFNIVHEGLFGIPCETPANGVAEYNDSLFNSLSGFEGDELPHVQVVSRFVESQNPRSFFDGPDEMPSLWSRW